MQIEVLRTTRKQRFPFTFFWHHFYAVPIRNNSGFVIGTSLHILEDSGTPLLSKLFICLRTFLFFSPWGLASSALLQMQFTVNRFAKYHFTKYHFAKYCFANYHSISFRFPKYRKPKLMQMAHLRNLDKNSCLQRYSTEYFGVWMNNLYYNYRTGYIIFPTISVTL